MESKFKPGDRIIFRDGEFHGVVVDITEIIGNDGKPMVITKWDDSRWSGTNQDEESMLDFDMDYFGINYIEIRKIIFPFLCDKDENDS